MSLPIIQLNDHERWDCHQCGVCCRGSLIPLSVADHVRLVSQNWSAEPGYEKLHLTVRDASAASGFRLAHRSDGSCVFLGDDGLCRIHARMGLEAKPTVCQTFPFQLVPQDKQAVLTLRRSCPSAAADLGQPVSEYLAGIKRQVREDQLNCEASPAPMIKSGEQRDWATARAVLKCAADLLRDERYPPVRRLVHALQFAGLLDKAQLRGLSDSKIIELALTLADLAPDESKPFFADRQAPRGYSRVMFRLLAIDCARIHPNCRHLPKWSARWQLVKIAYRIVRGAGRTPLIDATFPRTRFDTLERPLGAMSADVYKPLNRYFETVASSYLYAIADRSGWSIVESLRGLTLLYPIGLYLLRWVAADRQPLESDMVPIVVALARSQGYAPLVGAMHRSRLNALAMNNELERLVVWYAQ